ncbi:MAG: hypothetical protein CM15mP127_08150 [Gammaproteobacteria bacterium]|nr:MAG: hypothetical protein CM15mP127_08150 [Gammaproteobacteria bacterium]
MFAFEQVGGAEQSLDMAKTMPLKGMPFGRQIGSYQFIKHKLADMYISLTLARSNCYYGAWALSSDSPELKLAAATSRVSATKASTLCKRKYTNTWRKWLYLGIRLSFVLQKVKSTLSEHWFRTELERKTCFSNGKMNTLENK